jgi:hypothetical protein
MALAALFFLFGLSLFNLGGSTPGTGTGDVLSGVGTAAPSRATLGIKTMRPLVVVGRGFKPAERVRVSGAGTKNVTARRGTFTVRLGRAPCAGFTLVARGSAGSRATLNFANVQSVHCLD